MTDEILDSIPKNSNIETKLISERNKLFFIVAALLLVNIILHSIKYFSHINIIALFKQIVSNTFLNIASGFFIGIFIGMIPYRKLNFDKKYLRASLYTIITINIITIIGEIVRF